MRARNKQAFTLLEVIMSVAIAGLVLAGATIFLMSFTGIWAQRSGDRFINSHISGMVRVIEDWVFEGIRNESLEWRELEGFWVGDQPVLSLEIQKSSALLHSMQIPGAGAEIHFVPREEGLWVVWRSDMQEFLSTSDFQRTFLSPYLTRFRYHYQEEGVQAWRDEDRLIREAGGVYRPPRLLELVFETPLGEKTALIDLGSPDEGEEGSNPLRF